MIDFLRDSIASLQSVAFGTSGTVFPGGISLKYPLMLLIPPLFIAARFLLSQSRPSASVYFSSTALLDELPKSLKVTLRAPLLFLLSLISVILISFAAARPQRVTAIESPNLGRNIVLVLDLSRSMTANDFPTDYGAVSRMEGVKSVVSEYVRTRTSDRVGLVVFGNAAYLQSPLTTDTGLVGDMVQDLSAGVAGDGTAIGEGLGLGLKLLKDLKEGTRAVILLTDGVNNAGSVSPLKAARVAKELGVPVHTIGIGSGSTPLGNSLLGFNLGPVAEFDEKTLQEIASITNGVYFNAQSLNGLKEVYAKIDALTEDEHEAPNRTVVEELFVPYLAGGLFSFLVLATLALTVFRRVP